MIGIEPNLPHAADQLLICRKTKPEKIVIYTQGAQIHRNAVVNVMPGQNTIVFTGLENCINTSAIQVGGTGGESKNLQVVGQVIHGRAAQVHHNSLLVPFGGPDEVLFPIGRVGILFLVDR